MADYLVHVRVTTDYESVFDATDDQEVQELASQLTPEDFDPEDMVNQNLEVLYAEEQDAIDA